ncbi:MAG: tetratricopeptide repeat protein [Myxococcota bacterium]
MSELVDTLADHMATLQEQTRARGREQRHQRMREQLLATDDGTDSPPRWRAAVWPVTGAVAMVALVLVVLWALRPQPLTFEVGPTARAETAAAFFSATDDEPLALSFSDGSVVKLRPRARMRVAVLGSDAAGLVLESGALDLKLRPSASTWSIEAGPFRVRAEGADLVLRWDPDAQTFTLDVREGRAMVEGPGLEGVREATAGEAMVLGASESPRAVVPATAPESEGPAPAKAEPVASAAQPELAEPSRPRRSGRAKGASRSPGKAAVDWRALARDGNHAAALEAAEASGFSKLCNGLSASALLELADVARYAGRKSRAREALQSLRRRFPGTNAAATAAFDLGRLGAGCTGTSRWFQTYLQERPHGSMAKAARQRLRECTTEPNEEPGSSP